VNGKLERSTPKTEGSATTIPLPPALLLTLQNHRQYQREEAALKEGDWQEHGMVFASDVS
jgi:integrase